MNINKFEKVSIAQYAVSRDKTVEEVENEYNAIQLPARATKGSAGYDFYSPVSFVLIPGESIKICSGIRVSINEGQALFCFPRSSHGFKYRLQLDNTVGIVDSDYYFSDNEGHIMIKITNDGREGKNLVVNAGDKIMQAVFMPYFLTVDDNATEVRNGGLEINMEEEYEYEEYQESVVPVFQEEEQPHEPETSEPENSFEVILYTSHCPKCNILQKKLENKCSPDGNLLDIKICEDPDQIYAETGRMEVPLLKVNGNLMDYLAAVKWANSLPLKTDAN